MINILDWLVARMSEKSTWYGLVALIAAIGVTVSPELKESIALAGVAIAGVISTVTKEKNG